MVKAKGPSISWSSKHKIKRPGIHAKTKSSQEKSSKNYKKRYKGQGKRR